MIHYDNRCLKHYVNAGIIDNFEVFLLLMTENYCNEKSLIIIMQDRPI